MASEKRTRRVPAVITDTRRNPGFALGAFGLSAWAYIGMSHTIAAYEGPRLGYALGVAYEALVIGLAWEGRRRADRALETGRPLAGHARWLGGAIVVGILSGALAAWHGWLLGEGIFAISRAVAPVLAAVAVHLFFQSASSARELDRQAQIRADRETAVLDMLDAVRLAQIATEDERAARIADVNAAVTRVHRHVPAAVTAEVTRPHLESERTIRDVVQEAASLAGAWMPDPDSDDRPNRAGVLLPGIILPGGALPGTSLGETGLAGLVEGPSVSPATAEPADAEPADAGPDGTEPAPSEPVLAEPAPISPPGGTEMVDLVRTGSVERVHLEDKYAPVRPTTGEVEVPLTTHQISQIRVLRWEQNLSVHEVAARIGVSIAAVSKYAPSTEVASTETGSLASVH